LVDGGVVAGAVGDGEAWVDGDFGFSFDCVFNDFHVETVGVYDLFQVKVGAFADVLEGWGSVIVAVDPD